MITKRKRPKEEAILGIYFDRKSSQQLKDWERLNELSDKFGVSRSKLARISLGLGLALVEKDPILILGGN